MRIRLSTPILALGILLASAVPAGAAVTIGSNLLSAANSNNCGGTDCTTTNLTLGTDVATGGLRSPVNGTVTSWRFKSGSNGNAINLRVLRPGVGVAFTGGPTSAPAVATGGINGPFQTSLPISVGDAVGLNVFNDAIVMSTNASATQAWWTMPQLAEGSTRDGSTTANVEVLVQAVVEPSNTLTFGKQVKNKKKGSAQITVNVPNAGQLSVAETGVKIAGGPNRSIAAAGPLTLTVKAKGAKARKLREKGKVKLSPAFTFTPNNGIGKTQTQKVKLAKKL